MPFKCSSFKTCAVIAGHIPATSFVISKVACSKNVLTRFEKALQFLLLDSTKYGWLEIHKIYRKNTKVALK